MALARPLVEQVVRPDMIVAGELPLTFWKRRMLWRGEGLGGTGDYDPLDGINHVTLDKAVVPLRLDDPRLAAESKRDPRVRGFLSWSRMPLVIEKKGRAFLTDQRFSDIRGSRGNFLVPLDSPAAAP